MSWDEALFSFAWSGARRLLASSTPAEVLARRVDVTPELPRLEALARLLTGRPVTVSITDDRAGVAGDVFLLPRCFDFAPTLALNREALVLAIAWASIVETLEPYTTGDPLLDMALLAPAVKARLLAEFPPLAASLPRLERAAAAARPTPAPDEERSLVLEAIVRLALDQPLSESVISAQALQVWRGGSPTLPAPRRRWLTNTTPALPVPFWGWRLPRPPRAPKLQAPSDDANALSGGTEVAKPKVTHVERVQEPEQQLSENPLVHSFEKVHTLEEYKGGSKRIDGDDELAAHQKALDELDLRQVVRSHQRAKSLYRADLLLGGDVGDVEGDEAAPAEAHYDEWDEAKHAWKRDWCRLTTRLVPVTPEASATLASTRARLVRATTGVRAVFEQLEASRAWKLRQRDGSDVDVDAVVARYGALRAGSCSETRLYATRRRHSRDTAVLVLLDASLSTDAWVANRRVLDVEKEAVLVLGDALDGLFDEVAIAAFCSQTRRDCRFLVAKGFQESWALGAQRLVSLEPHGFTRIGPALRHATAELLACGAKQKLLLLVSDGKPSDVDRYEGRYGVADVHRAVLDAQGAGVVTHALAVDPAAKAWLPSMFGHGRASVVSKPEDLVEALARVTSTALRRG
ncbi:MAG: VWA domain-containing protein [Archangiaceae bacterium]|nr:VWA domain-containing protein [Archangiaceae bacterium]